MGVPVIPGRFESFGCPCTRECPDRIAGCHAECERYKEYEFERNKRYRNDTISSRAKINTAGKEKCTRRHLRDVSRGRCHRR